MSRRERRDVAVVGGGVVGAACALALAGQGLDVVLLEARDPPRWSADTPDLRVYAIAHDSTALLRDCGVWTDIHGARAQPYRRMQVWDAGGGSELAFDADALGMRELGWIVENTLIIDRLWARLAQAGVDVRVPVTVDTLEQDGAGVTLRLDDGSRLDARLVVAADGAASALRRLAGIDAPAHDYRQAGVVGYVDSSLSHRDTAWQRFLPSGPLALLPCVDARSSIVWTLPADEAARIRALDDNAFADALTRASGGRLGDLSPASARAAFPLRRQLAQTQLRGRVLLIGDAAHVVHPLAGQGVNLGLRDVIGLRDSVAAALRRGMSWDSPQRLARWARTRRSESAVAAHAFEAINRVWSNDAVAPVLLRSHAFGVAAAIAPLRNLLWKRAAGL